MVTHVGIDISKSYFDADCPNGVLRFRNALNGYRKLMKHLPAETYCVMESTGNYGYRLARALVQAKIPVAVVNPLSVKRFAQMKLRRTKTDQADARLLTEYAKIAELTPYVFASDAQEELHQLQGVYNQLIKQRTALVNQLEALKQLPHWSKDAIAAITKAIQQIDEALKDLAEKMRKLAMSECPEALTSLLGIPSIGPRTAIMFIDVTRGFTRFRSSKQLSAYFGVCPRITQSGSSVSVAGHICKSGLAAERSLLYMCALSAIRFNKPCKDLYQRLIARGKHKMVALVAVINKLIRQVFAVVTKHVPFNQDHRPKLAF